MSQQYARFAPGKNLCKIHNQEGVKFQAIQGWYKVTDEMADKLRLVRQQGEDSAFTFQVVDEAGYESAKKTDARVALNAGLPLPIGADPIDAEVLEKKAVASAKVADRDASLDEGSGDLTSADLKPSKKK